MYQHKRQQQQLSGLNLHHQNPSWPPQMWQVCTTLAFWGIRSWADPRNHRPVSICEHLWAGKKMRYPITPNSWTPCRTLPELAGACLLPFWFIHLFSGCRDLSITPCVFTFTLWSCVCSFTFKTTVHPAKNACTARWPQLKNWKLEKFEKLQKLGQKYHKSKIIKMRHGPRRPNFGFLRVPHCFVPHIGIQRRHLHNISAWLECCNQICSDEPPSPRLCHKSFSMVLPMFLLRKCRSSSCMSQAVWPFKIKKYTGRNMLTTSIAVIICFINHKND